MANTVLQEKYTKEVIPVVTKEFDIKNPFSMPKIEKVVVNMGIGAISKDKGKLEQIKKDLASITGQAPSVRLARVSVAGFNVREGQSVGLKVTLRGDKMYNFLTRLFSIVLPRLRDFRGVSGTSFDKNGNYTLAVLEHSVFPEIDITKSGSQGMEITIVTRAGSPEVAKRILTLIGMPFEKEDSAS